MNRAGIYQFRKLIYHVADKSLWKKTKEKKWCREIGR